MTMFAIRHKASGMYWWGCASLGDVWGSANMAKRFEFITAAFAVGLFECLEAPECWDVVPVTENQ